MKALTYPLSAARVRWLQHLVDKGETRWEKMPRQVDGKHITNRTWRPLVASGLINAYYGQRHYSEPKDWVFSITESGRAMLGTPTVTVEQP